LPDLAARWLAAELVDTEAVRMLAGHDPNDPWMLDKLLRDSINEANVSVPSSPSVIEDIAVDWVASTWRETGETYWAVTTLARLAITEPGFDLGLFIGLEDEWGSGWGRSVPELVATAEAELEGRLLGRSGGANES